MTTRKEVEVQREQYTFAGTGEVYSFTTLQETPEGFDEQAPYMLALVKLDVLHLHLTDDQGFRVESKTFPRLHEMGSDGKYFSQKEIH